MPLARIWMHNGMVRTAEEKMSKSVGNIFQLSEALDRFGAEAVVAYLSSGHYRQPLEFSERALEEAAARLERLRNFLAEPPAEGAEDPLRRRAAARSSSPRSPTTSTRRGRGRRCSSWSPRATGGRCPARTTRSPSCSPLLGLESLLGRAARSGRPRGARRCSPSASEARAERDFERADRIRDQLAERGWEVRDTPDGRAGCVRQ